MFHVKHAIASVATGCLHTGMTEHEHVGHEVSQQFSISHKKKRAPMSAPFHFLKISVNKFLIDVEML